MQIVFVKRTTGPERLVCDAEIVFGDSGPLAGLKLVGFNLWRTADGDVSVTLPARAFGAGSDRRFFDYLRANDGDAAAVKRLKAWILDEYRRQAGAAA
jgi:hypothetical protein